MTEIDEEFKQVFTRTPTDIASVRGYFKTVWECHILYHLNRYEMNESFIEEEPSVQSRLQEWLT